MKSATKNSHKILAIFMTYILLSFGCKKEEVDKGTYARLSTSALIDITDSSASCGGVVTFNGGTAITSRGICWSTGNPPSISDQKIISTNNSDNYSELLSNLSPNTTYYVRAFATNSAGTSYGGLISFKTLQTGTVSDIDGNIYHTIKIGTQTWMVENLKTTKFNDGTSIKNICNNTTWDTIKTPAYCWYANNPNTYKDCGALYNGYAVKTGKLCPKGWHIPTNEEWTNLTTYLGGYSIAGGKMKETETSHWTSPNTGATNESGFSALPGGSRGNSGIFSNIGTTSNWWSSTDVGIGDLILNMAVFNNSVQTNNAGDPAKYGLSIRCIKN